MLKRLSLKLAALSLFLMILPAYGTNMTTKETKLDNGLKVVVREDHRAPVVVAQVWYKVGSADEYTGITGISHALEHMMFKGTEEFPDGSYSELIAKNGGNDNAFTTDDFTAYYAELAADKLEMSLELEADRMANLIITKEEFDKEKQVVMEERRLRTDDNPQMTTYERFMAAANISGPYHHPVIGWMHDIEQMTHEDLQRWYDNWYAPNNAVLVVVGAVKAEEVFDLAEKYFGNIEKRAELGSKAFKEIGALGQTRVTVKKEASLPYMIMGFNVPSVHNFEPDEAHIPYALMVGAYALDGGNSSRFAKKLIRKDKVALGLSAYYDPFQRYDGQFKVMGIPAGDHSVETLEQAILAELKLLQDEPLGEQELQKIKNQIIANEIFEKDSMAEQAIMIGSFESIGLSWRDADAYVDNIKRVTPEQVQQAAQRFFNPDYMTVAVLEPLPIGGQAEALAEHEQVPEQADQVQEGAEHE